jgi:hypothetical protein
MPLFLDILYFDHYFLSTFLVAFKAPHLIQLSCFYSPVALLDHSTCIHYNQIKETKTDSIFTPLHTPLTPRYPSSPILLKLRKFHFRKEKKKGINWITLGENYTVPSWQPASK